MKRLGRKGRAPVAEGQPSWTSVFTDRLKSTDPTLSFTAHIRVTWQRHTDTGLLAGPRTASLIARREVEEIAGRCDILRPAAAEQDITAALQDQLPIAESGVLVTDFHLRLSVDDKTSEAALLAERLQQEYRRKKERLRLDHELDELARSQARAREMFLREEILADPAAARLYGLLEGASKHWSRMGGPPPATNLEELVREVRRWQPGQQWVTVAQLLHDFVAKLTEAGRKELLVILADAVRAFGDESTAQRLALLSGEAQ
ncbi:MULTISPECIES: hypothetical protein [unclassified Streptomyces]|uniref:hypothetical protein n=1 Tax=unclassified Streptomyces TaxID=2593676 RepID=UPI00158765E5|nr:MULTISPECIES: hypothetical protein [unclassified Streptomyces]